MPLRILQKSWPAADDRFDWAVWIDGTDEELDDIESVRYVLHPTFPGPVRDVRDRQSNFRTKSNGWGEFRILAHVRMADGQTKPLSVWLRLFGPSRRRVFISAQSADADLANLVASALKEHDLVILDEVAGVSAGRATIAETSEGLYGADAVIAVLSSDAIGPWVAEELRSAKAADIPVYVVIASESVSLPPWLDDGSHYVTDDRNSLDELAMNIRGI